MLATNPKKTVVSSLKSHFNSSLLTHKSFATSSTIQLQQRDGGYQVWSSDDLVASTVYATMGLCARWTPSENSSDSDTTVLVVTPLIFRTNDCFFIRDLNEKMLGSMNISRPEGLLRVALYVDLTNPTFVIVLLNTAEKGLPLSTDKVNEG